MNATTFLENRHGKMCHHLPKSSIIDLMDDFHQYRKEQFDKAKKDFQSEQFLAQHNIDELRKKSTKDSYGKMQESDD